MSDGVAGREDPEQYLEKSDDRNEDAAVPDGKQNADSRKRDVEQPQRKDNEWAPCPRKEGIELCHFRHNPSFREYSRVTGVQ
jgi:hypothetical protein